MNNKDSHIRQLLKRWITGDIKSSGEQRLDEAAKDDKFLAQALSGLRSSTDTDHDQNITNLRKQLGLEKSKSRFARFTPLRIAATIALLITASWLVWNGPGFSSTDNLAMSKEAAPASSSQLDKTPTFDQEQEETVVEPAPTVAQDVSPEEAPKSPNNDIVQTSPPPPPVSAPPSDYSYSNNTTQAGTAKDKTIVLEENTPDLPVLASKLTNNTADDAVLQKESPQNEETAVIADTYAVPAPVQGPILTTTNAGVLTPAMGYRVIEGRVIDSENYPLIGVNILEEGESNGTVSDLDGYFTLAVKKGNDTQLNCSYIGFDTHIVDLNEEGYYQITLDESALALEEVTITGYSQKRRSRDSATMSQAETAPYSSTNIEPFGGFNSFKDYIKQNTPDGVGRGKIRLHFSINQAGRPVNIKVIRSTNTSLNDLAIGLLASGPNWLTQDIDNTQVVEYLMRIR